MKNDNRLYKKICQAAVCIAAITCSFNMLGCGALSSVDEALREHKEESDDKYWTGRNVPPVELDLTVTCPGKEANFDLDLRVSRCVYKYLEDGDKEMLMSMFAPSVIDSDKDLESELDELFKYYQKLDIAGYEVRSNSEYKVHRLDPGETILEFTYHTRFVYADETYDLDILFVNESTLNEELLGVHGIKLRNRDTNEAVIVNTINTDI